MVSIDENNKIEIVPFEVEAYRDALERWKPEIRMVALENVHSMPGQGSSSSFSFGEESGWLKGLLYGLRVPTCLVQPQTWKKCYGLNLNKSYSKADKKRKTIETVKRMYPDVSLKRTERSRVDDDNIADSIMIATWTKKQYP